MSGATIVVNSLSKSYPEEQVLQEIDLEIQEGEFFVLIGPSGCGKSTFLECIAGLRKPDSGTIHFSGRNIMDTPVEDRGVGYVFQEFEETLFPNKTVGENIAFGLRHGDGNPSEEEIEQQVDDILELLSIQETKNDIPSELSGGQQQRVELARQLVRECDITLFDDPLADLDYKLQKRMELEMRAIHREREGTFIYVTHNQDQALKLADRVAVMNQGIIEQVGSPHEVYKQPENAFVARFLGDSNPLVGEVSEVSDDNIRVETEIGEISATGIGDDFERDFRSILIVRPEAINIGDAASSQDNQFEATLEGETYMGETTEITLSIEGTSNDFVVLKPGKPDVGAVGDDVLIGWDSSDCQFFKRKSEARNVTVEDLMEI